MLVTAVVGHKVQEQPQSQADKGVQLLASVTDPGQLLASVTCLSTNTGLNKMATVNGLGPVTGLTPSSGHLLASVQLLALIQLLVSVTSLSYRFQNS